MLWFLLFHQFVPLWYNRVGVAASRLRRSFRADANTFRRGEQNDRQIQRVSVSKNQLAETAVAAGVVGVESEVAGAEQMVEGVETLQIRCSVGAVGKVALAAGASDLTRAADLEIMAVRMAFC